MNYCGNCKHWHESTEQTYRCKLGDCDKIPKGEKWFDTEFNTDFEYDGYSFEDECYDEIFHCFESR